MVYRTAQWTQALQRVIWVVFQLTPKFCWVTYRPCKSKSVWLHGGGKGNDSLQGGLFLFSRVFFVYFGGECTGANSLNIYERHQSKTASSWISTCGKVWLNAAAWGCRASSLASEHAVGLGTAKGSLVPCCHCCLQLRSARRWLIPQSGCHRCMSAPSPSMPEVSSPHSLLA